MTITIKKTKKSPQKILMVAAENGALPGGKVGGIGDVVFGMPRALASANQQIEVVTPGYGAFSRLPGAELVSQFKVTFRGTDQRVGLYKIPLKNNHKNITQWVIEHPLFASGGTGKIYCDDPDYRPFATDASKFALFGAAVAQAIVDNLFGPINVIHLHDWHAALVSVLREYVPAFKALKSISMVYTIHNLALQGIRPLAGDESSLKAWFPSLKYAKDLVNDPVHKHCFNPVRACINLCDKIHAVSPNYAREILLPSLPEQGYYGGEGLQTDLRKASDEGRLFGILNGCEYPDKTAKKRPANSLSKKLLASFTEPLLKWIGSQTTVQSAHLIASMRISSLLSTTLTARQFLVTSVGRITDQKVMLLLQKMFDGTSALEHILNIIGDDGLFILLGSGDSKFEQALTRIASHKNNFIFLKGYSESISASLYKAGDLFLMPSSFEPCGISQMYAMRAGQPCLAHSVGGLSDTITDDKNGFTFSGNTQLEQAQNMITRFEEVFKLKQENPKKWQTILTNSLAARFLWSDSAKRYSKYLYVKH